jgi:hypothetical protein
MEATVAGRGPSAAKGRGSESARSPRFSSARELREVLEALLETIDIDERVGTLVRAAGPRMRFEFPDRCVVLNMAPAEESAHNIRWHFDDDIDWEPRLRLWMDSTTANRYLQGRESLAIGIARGQVRADGDARSALLYVPAMKLLIEPYRRLVDERFPHLAVDA